MKLYHGSTVAVESPDVTHSRGSLDFGPGFYLTSLESQARRWALRKASFENAPTGIISEFELDLNEADFNVLRFETENADWVEFVCQCRRGEPVHAGYDVVIGGVADDRVYEAVSMYFKGLWDMETTLSALKFYDVNDQYCFLTQRAIDNMLAFERSYEVSDESHE